MSTTEENVTERQDERELGDAYTPLADAFDEMRDAGSGIRHHWQPFSRLLSELGAEEIHHRWENARRMIHDNGVTYNVYGDPAGMDRPWLLDAVPFIVAAEEWETVRLGLIQRARLLDAVIQDIYGAQNLLHEGLLPPAPSKFTRMLPCLPPRYGVDESE